MGNRLMVNTKERFEKLASSGIDSSQKLEAVVRLVLELGVVALVPRLTVCIQLCLYGDHYVLFWLLLR